MLVLLVCAFVLFVKPVLFVKHVFVLLVNPVLLVVPTEVLLVPEVLFVNAVLTLVLVERITEPISGSTNSNVLLVNAVT